MPEQATIKTTPKAAVSPPRGAAAALAQRPGAAAEPQARLRGPTTKPLAAGFAAVFASALQDNAKEPAPLSGNKPGATITAPGGSRDQPDGTSPLKAATAPATPDGPQSMASAAPREDRLKHPRQSAPQGASEGPDALTPAPVAAPGTTLPTPPRALTAQVSLDFNAALSSNDSTPIAAKAGHVAHETPTTPPATGHSAIISREEPAKPSTLGQPVPMPLLEANYPVSQPLAVGMPPVGNFSVGAATPAAMLQTPEPISSTACLADQVAPAVIRISSADGARHISLQLTPTDLGPVDIRIEQPKDGPVTITLTVQHPRTLALLQRDLEQLSQTLDRAGLGTEGRQVSLHLAPTHTKPAPADPVSSASQAAAGGMPDQGSGQESGQGSSQGVGPNANPNADTGHQSRSRGGPDFAVEGPQSEIGSPPPAFITYQTDQRPGLNITA